MELVVSSTYVNVSPHRAPNDAAMAVRTPVPAGGLRDVSPGRYVAAMTFDDIEATLPWGLHDAYLEAIAIDWLGARLELTVRLMMSERQDMDQRARITVTGLVYCAIDPPEIEPKRGYVAIPEHGLWIDTGSGCLDAAAKGQLPKSPAGCFLQWIFVHDWNRYIHICGSDVSLAWLEPAPVPARARTRALFPGDVVPDPED